MYVTTLPINVFLRHLLSASEMINHLGTVLLLARTVEAGAQQQEMIDGWTSFHDLTGASLSVLCPVAPSGPSTDSGSIGGFPDPRRMELAAAEGMRVDVPATGGTFERAFWDSLRQEPDFGRSNDKIRRPGEDHKRGWTRAVTSAAGFFGLNQLFMPCLVILSTRERHGMVVDIEKDLSLYELFDQLLARIGTAPAQLDDLLGQRRSTQWQLNDLTDRRVRLEPQQVSAITRRLGEVEHMAPDLIAECRTLLENIGRDDASARDLSQRLRELILILPPPQELRLHNLRSDVRPRLQRVVTKIERSLPSAEELSTIPQLQTKVDRLDEQIPPLQQLVDSLSLSSAVLSAAEEILAPLEKQRLTPPEALANWSFTYLKRRQGITPPTVRRSA
ncbi:hypothetical protein ABZ930_36890 [Streptomyces sp. NPDC046716]|uniref:hypothetical protein n=1 Tax=Streptomyces sp. NPDC046716 TaxID=3157093 RepID=UPI0033CA025C